MYWLLIILLIVVIMCTGGRREGFQELFGFSGMKEPIDDTSFTYGPSGGYPDYTDVTDEDGVNHEEVNTCVKATMEFINKKLNMCSQPVETSKIRKLRKESDIIYECKFMFVVTSTNYPFMLGVETDVKNGKVVRAATQDMYRGKLPGDVHEENFKDFSEIESFKVYSR